MGEYTVNIINNQQGDIDYNTPGIVVCAGPGFLRGGSHAHIFI